MGGEKIGRYSFLGADPFLRIEAFGNDVVITAPHTGDVVKLVQLSTESSLMGFVGASRPAV